MSRSYSQSTLTQLHTLSGNLCAFPSCSELLFVPPTEASAATFVGEKCHIYAHSTEGPRGKAGLTAKERNSPENLILLCRNHHALVDRQHETYPADLLKKWKKDHESKMYHPQTATERRVDTGLLSFSSFPIDLVDQKIDEEVWKLRKARFFVEFDSVQASLILGRKLSKGDFSGGTDAVVCHGLAWCSRLLARSDEISKAEEFLKLAKHRGSCPEVDIAEAFILSEKGDKNAGLQMLAQTDLAISRSAAVFLASHHDSGKAFIEWIDEVGFETTTLDSEGKFILLKQQLELSHWDAATMIVDALADQDFEDTPVLHYVVAISRLLATVPMELRRVVLTQIPVEAHRFPLASDALGINSRRKALQHFEQAMVFAMELGCPKAAMVNEEYALWLQLRDSKYAALGLKTLRKKLCGPKLDLHLVRLGIRFGIELDIARVEKNIAQQIALNGGITQEAAVARFALAFTKKSPMEVANYVDKHYEELGEFIDKKAMRTLQIEMLAQAGATDRATNILESLIEDGLTLTVAENAHLRGVISEATGVDSVTVRKTKFEQDDSIGNLASLVDDLESKEHWEDLCDFGRTLFDRTRSLQDAERLSTALYNAHKTEQLVKFLQQNSDLLTQSKQLQLLFALALYYEGKLVESRTELARISQCMDDPHHRILRINLSIALGDWISLNTFIAAEYDNRDERSAEDLISVAQIAIRLNAPHAKDLIFSAVDKAENDAEILATAYYLSTSAGWEDDEQVGQWLRKAIELSGEDGPLYQKSIKDILDQKPNWDRWELEIRQQLDKGEIPLFVSARALNTSLIDLTLFPALANQNESDLRRRILIPSFSGKCRKVEIAPSKITAGLDATTLLTLSFLNILEQSLDAFKKIFIPHSTLAWLFDENQRANFHQPSRIRESHQIQQLMAADALEEFTPSVLPDSNLASEIGDDLASMIAEAEKDVENDNIHRVVVRSAPVRQLSAYLEEEVDLTAHTPVLRTCTDVVEKLKQQGQVTTDEAKKAYAYLQRREKPWSNQTNIADNAVLYLDDLAVSYLLHLDLLGRIRVAGLRPIVSSRVVTDANSFITYEGYSKEVKKHIEHIRSALSSRIESRSITVGRISKTNESDKPLLSDHPTIDVFGLTQDCDLIISDDRFLNQRIKIDDGVSSSMVATTLDLVDALVDIGELSEDERIECRTRLRRAGHIFVPVWEEELVRHLSTSEIRNGHLNENAELKSIRDSVLQVRMSKWLQLPHEADWLLSTIEVIVRVLKSLWEERGDFTDIKVRSNWLLEQIDMRGWAHFLGMENGDVLVKLGRGEYLVALLTPSMDMSPEVRIVYWSWIEERILAPIQEQFPELFEWMTDHYKNLIAEVSENVLNEKQRP